MQFAPQRGWMVGWSANRVEVIDEYLRKCEEGLEPVLRHFNNTKRGEGPVFMLEFRIRQRMPARRPRRKDQEAA